ncbi:MAG: putative toxin-antitoxin system toxin component, PIN family [Nitrospirae bacterium]|nr:putative toxin-antitoxin system toxin component, PIN family [Nitrospirota bacterium]MBF0554565.1 putative toxin-antitoxin system toxin component, PIN family [Nitrospirota bacterium]
MLKVVIDTNILVSSFLKRPSLPDLIITMIQRRWLLLCLTSEIMAEYEGVLERDKFATLRNKHDKEIKDLFNSFHREALWVKPIIPVEIIKNDPADNKFLECALEARADYFITGNIRHFPSGKFEQTRIVNPQEFITHIAPLFFK